MKKDSEHITIVEIIYSVTFTDEEIAKLEGNEKNLYEEALQRFNQGYFDGPGFNEYGIFIYN